MEAALFLMERGHNMLSGFDVLDRYGRPVPDKKYFGHCWFKGGTTVTNTSTYTPTEYELQLQKAQADYAKAIAPNSLWLNNTARGILQDSLGAVQVDFNGLNKQAQNQLADAVGGLKGVINNSNQQTAAANRALQNYSNQYSNLGGRYDSANIAANRALDSESATISGLQNGVLPSAYQQNMQNAISSALQNTMGSTLNSLAGRGVLNSSVTNTAMNDISRNAANAVAQQYQSGISQLAGLANQQGNIAQQKFNNANATTGALGNLIGQQGSLTQQQLTNNQQANSMASGVNSNLINAASQPITTAAAAQEAAQTPAINLWQASLGLNGATTGALAAAAGKGTTTSTSTQNSSGGGLLSGLMGGLL